jgi:hypothetical protein
MVHSVWSSNLTDSSAIGASLETASHFPQQVHTRDPESWVAGDHYDASSRMSYPYENSSEEVGRGLGSDMTVNGIPSPVLGDYHVAPERFAFSPTSLPMVISTPPGSSQEHIDIHKRHRSVEMTDSHAQRSRFGAPSPSNTSEHMPESSFSSSASEHSASPYPSPGPQAYTALSNSQKYIAEPLVAGPASIYTDYFSNPTETLCLFNDIEAQFYPSPISPASSSSPGPVTTTINPAHQVVANYSGPIRNHIVSMSTDGEGVVWIVFPYSKNKEVKNHTIRCDVDKVPPSALREDIKTVSAAVLPLIVVTKNRPTPWLAELS